tara:strand:+ start:4587 stop:5594 length:1008 start_codon:yes stop_codon:yes gene_type:complete
MHLKFNLTKKILSWYDNNKRILPWRVSKNPKKRLYYRILSEFMLQQTQVKTVVPYFEKFTKKFKSLEELSRASEKDVLKLWEGLGYYRRARNLLMTSKILVNKLEYKLPKDLNDMKKLPGVGDYTANALSALVHNMPSIAIDGNVKRVFARIFNLNISKKKDIDDFIFKNKKHLISLNRSSDYVEALMEFGALMCRPKNPICKNCIFRKECRFNKSNFRNIKIKKEHKNLQYDIFCYVNKKKQIALSKYHNLNFLKSFNLPKIKERKENPNNQKKEWVLLKNYKNSISNKKLNINLYYKFSEKKPLKFTWHSLGDKKEFMPTFTKKIIKQISVLF